MRSANSALQATAATPRSSAFMENLNVIIAAHARFRWSAPELIVNQHYAYGRIYTNYTLRGPSQKAVASALAGARRLFHRRVAVASLRMTRHPTTKMGRRLRHLLRTCQGVCIVPC